LSQNWEINRTWPGQRHQVILFKFDLLSTTTSAGHGKTIQVWVDLKAMKVKERQILKNYEKSEMKQIKNQRFLF
jgi:hypothetical protein